MRDRVTNRGRLKRAMIPLNLWRNLATRPVSTIRAATAVLHVDTDIGAILGVRPSAVSAWRKEVRAIDRLPNQLMANWESLGVTHGIDSIGGNVGPLYEGLYAMIRCTKPKEVVETGVAFGFSSAYILQGMADNGFGHLFSIDLPSFGESGYVNQDGVRDAVSVGQPRNTGAVIPHSLRKRWSLRVGPSNPVLGETLSGIGSIDLFFHDSDHSRANMMWEFRTAWPRLKPGGLLLADDVSKNDAFVTFSQEVGVMPKFWPTRWVRYGVLRKPADPHSEDESRKK